MQKVDVFLTGQMLEGAELRASATRLAALARIDDALALRMLQARRPIRVKKEVDAAVGLKYQRALAAIGVDAQLYPAQAAEPVRKKTLPQHGAAQAARLPKPAAPGPGSGVAAKPLLGPVPPVPAAQLPVQTAAADSEPALVAQLQGAAKSLKILLTQAPGRAPGRGLAVTLPSGPKTRRSKKWLSTPRVVPARQGWHWIRQAWWMFTGEPYQWLLLFWLSCSLLGLVLLAPNAHLFLLVLFLPLFLGMYISAAHRQNQDEPIRLLQSVLFAAKNWKSLLLFGLLSLILFLFVGASFFFLNDAGLFRNQSHAAASGLLSSEPMPLLVLAGLLLFPGIPMLSGYAFTIPLILLADLRPIHAFQLGVYGCIKNWQAMLLALALSTPFFALCIVLLQAIQGWLPWLYWPLVTLILFILAPPMVVMAVLLVYNAFHDIFSIAAENDA